MRILNPLTHIDFYKADHRRQYPVGTELVVSNLTPRSGKHGNVFDRSRIVFFGLQYFVKYFLMDVWQTGFFDRPRDEVVAEYKRRMDNSLGKDSIPVDHIGALHDLGYLPLEIKALPEGSIVPVGIPCLTLHNTRPEFFWLTNYLETILSAYIWQSCTSATTAFNYRKLFEVYAESTGSPKEFVDFQGHDFSFRGMSSPQSAVMSGAGHLLSFKGTDTVLAIDFLEEYYNADCTKELVGCSVPATEHSVVSLGGEDNELETIRRLICDVYPSGIVSLVSDTWDFFKVISEYAKILKPEIMARNGKVVFRPDSGNPVDILCGDPLAPKGSLEFKGAVEVLWDLFGGTTTSKGFKLLDSHVGLLYGDSITYDMASQILERLFNKGFASANVVLGIGSFTYQFVTRDTWGFAVKATFGRVNGIDRNIFKDPKTDQGSASKKSAKGLLRVIRDEHDVLRLVECSTWADYMDDDKNLLRPVFRDGKLLREHNLAELRSSISANMKSY